ETGSYKPSYLHNPGVEPLCALTTGQAIDIAAQKWKDRDAVVSLYQGHRYTFSEVRDKADKIAAGLMQLGLKRGDRLGIWGPNSSEWFISRLAAARGGFIAVQLDPAYQSPELQYSLNKVEIKMLIISPSFKTNNCYEIVRAVVPELDKCADAGTELTCEKVPSLKRIIVMSDTQYKGAHRLKDVSDSALPETVKKVREQQVLIQPDDGCCILFSSGTTGTPKGALISHHSIINNSLLCGKRTNMGMKTNMLIITQFCHLSGTAAGIICAILFGSTTVLPCPTFDSVKALEATISERCTHVVGAPSLYVDMMANSKQHDLKVTTLQVAFYGGAPCSEQLALQIKGNFERSNINKPCFGMTETCVTFVARADDTIEQRTQTVGYIADHCEVKVVDKEGRMVPMGTPGELWIRGYGNMLGYWNDDQKTREFLRDDRWAKTGDEFILQEDGYGRIVGRVKECIIRIGDKIFPSEIENFFTQHPDILEAQAFGVPDPKVGEEICVYLRLRGGVVLTEDNIWEFCKDKVSEYRIPKYIRFTKQFQRTSFGKVRKFKLLEELMEELNTQKQTKR
ncbi:hypothetical protein L9F63_016035, partial [Diploptera punctata]